MTKDIGCEAYRQTVIGRATDTSNSALGSVWADDSVGALLQHLDSLGILDDTFFLFQLDQGQEGKASLFEPGTRIAQIIQYPKGISGGTRFDGLVSTIDIGPTLLEYSEIDNNNSPGWYPMDGFSWKSAVESNTMLWNDRCIVMELATDRAVTCGCNKYLSIDSQSTNSGTARRGRRFGLMTTTALVRLCTANGDYITSPATSPETTVVNDVDATQKLQEILNCHLGMTQPKSTSEYGLCNHLLQVESLPPFPVAPTGEPTTATPTMEPLPVNSLAPTTSPPTTDAPVPNEPNQTPTSKPTQSITPGPSSMPSKIPVSDPTATPSHRPTRLPTAEPTAMISSAPFQTSSSVPTRNTTLTPSFSPTNQRFDTVPPTSERPTTANPVQSVPGDQTSTGPARTSIAALGMVPLVLISFF